MQKNFVSHWGSDCSQLHFLNTSFHAIFYHGCRLETGLLRSRSFLIASHVTIERA